MRRTKALGYVDAAQGARGRYENVRVPARGPG